MFECKEKKQDNTIAMVMAIVGIVVVVAGVAFAVYKFISKRREDKELQEMLDAMEEEDSLIDIEFTYPEEDTQDTLLTEEEE